MDCARFQSRLAELLAAEDSNDPVGGTDVSALARHADGCPRCAPSRDLLTVVQALRGGAFRVSPPDDATWGRIEAGLDRAISRDAARGRTGRVAAAAAAVLLAAVAWRSGEHLDRVAPSHSASSAEPWADDSSWDSSYGFGIDPGPIPDLDELTETEREALLEWARERGGDA